MHASQAKHPIHLHIVNNEVCSTITTSGRGYTKGDTTNKVVGMEGKLPVPISRETAGDGSPLLQGWLDLKLAVKHLTPMHEAAC